MDVRKERLSGVVRENCFLAISLWMAFVYIRSLLCCLILIVMIYFDMYVNALYNRFINFKMGDDCPAI